MLTFYKTRVINTDVERCSVTCLSSAFGWLAFRRVFLGFCPFPLLLGSAAYLQIFFILLQLIHIGILPSQRSFRPMAHIRFQINYSRLNQYTYHNKTHMQSMSSYPSFCSLFLLRPLVNLHQRPLWKKTAMIRIESCYHTIVPCWLHRVWHGNLEVAWASNKKWKQVQRQGSLNARWCHCGCGCGDYSKERSDCTRMVLGFSLTNAGSSSCCHMHLPSCHLVCPDDHRLCNLGRHRKQMRFARHIPR